MTQKAHKYLTGHCSRDPDIFSGHISPDLLPPDIPPPVQIPHLFTWCGTFIPLPPPPPSSSSGNLQHKSIYNISDLPLTSTKFIAVYRLGSKNFPPKIGRLGLGSELRVVGRLLSGVWVSCQFSNFRFNREISYRCGGILSVRGNIRGEYPAVSPTASYR